MRPIQNGKSISIHFKDEELELLKEFEEYRKKNYFTRSGWVKQHMQRELHQQKQHCFR
jgi:metal-responsive CopG/Arc/MetJ family transcriptional regulator|tara:strand:+ start:54 stop:227 length:174 start_codon:yes stop_codon:yes gene_type:complete